MILRRWRVVITWPGLTAQSRHFTQRRAWRAARSFAAGFQADGVTAPQIRVVRVGRSGR